MKNNMDFILWFSSKHISQKWVVEMFMYIAICTALPTDVFYNDFF